MMGQANHIRAQLVTLTVKFQQNSVHLTQIPHQVRPGDFYFPFVDPLLQVDLESQGQETGDYVAYTGIIPVMIQGTNFQGGFLLPESSFNPPQAFVGLGHLSRRQIR